jgi:sugar lactone lactonase YvrE
MREFRARPWYRPPTEELRYLPECPHLLRNFPGTEAILGWVAIQHGPGRHDGSLNLLNLATRVNTTFPLNGRPGFFVETTSPGVLLVGMDRQFILVDARTGETTGTEIRATSDERVIINDGISIPNGLIFGTKDLALRDPIAALYHYDCTTRQVREIRGRQYCSNGKYFRQDENTALLIDIDTIPKTITRYHFASGFREVADRTLLIQPEALPAPPDGLRPTPNGESIIVAYYNAAAADTGTAQELRVSDGEVLTTWLLPGSPRVTCPELAIIDGAIQVIFTTAVEGMPSEALRLAPHAGTLFCADTPLQSLPEPPPLFPLESLRNTRL